MSLHKDPQMIVTVSIMIFFIILTSIIFFFFFLNRNEGLSVEQGLSLLIKILIPFTAHFAHSPPSSSCLSPGPQSSTYDTGEKSEIQTVNCLTELMMSSLQCLDGELPN